MGINSLVNAPVNKLELAFYVDATSPLIVVLPTDPHSLLAPYTDIMSSDTLDDKLGRNIYSILVSILKSLLDAQSLTSELLML